MLWAIVLKTKLYYGDFKINKLTFLPLDYTIAGLAIKLCYNFVKYFFVAKQLCLEVQGNYEIFNGPLSLLFTLFMNIDLLMFAFFIMQQIYERLVLWNFIAFQKKTDFNQLDVKRFEF